MSLPARRRVHGSVVGALGALLLAALLAHAEDDPPGEPPQPRWVVGDLHVHASPPDAVGHASQTVVAAIASARKAGLDFVAITPHDADARFVHPTDPAKGDVSGQRLVELAAEGSSRPAPAGTLDMETRPIVVIAGWEFTRESPGHLGITFANVEDLTAFAPAEKAKAALAKGALVVVNHPYFRPVVSDLPLMKLLTGDRRWRPFFGEEKDDLAWNGIEVWHERSVLVQKIHTNLAAKFPATQMLADSLGAWDTATRTQRRRITAVGGSDCHGKPPYAVAPMPMLSVRTDAFDVAGLRRGLLAARVTFGKDGGPAARDFAATSDVPGESASIGDSLRATSEVRLAWTGKATLVENGERVGEFDGGAERKLAAPGAFAFWRIEKPGDAYSNMIYANLP